MNPRNGSPQAANHAAERHPRSGFLFGLAAYGLWGVLPLYFRALRHIQPIDIVAHRVLWSLPFLTALITLAKGWNNVRDAVIRPKTLGVLALTALLVSLGRPERTVAALQRQGSVIMVTDTSGSMQATDVKPTRLAAAQTAARALTKKLPDQFNLGLVTFNNVAESIAAPTTDADGIANAEVAGGPVAFTSMTYAQFEFPEILSAYEAVAIREAPVLLEPAVEGGECRGGRVGIVLERLFDADAERREEQRRSDALAVHHREPRVAIPVLRADRLELAERIAHLQAIGVAAIPAVERARARHRVERRIRDVAVHPPADEQTRATVRLPAGVFDRPRGGGGEQHFLPFFHFRQIARRADHFSA